MPDAWTVFTAGKRAPCTKRKKLDGSVSVIGVPVIPMREAFFWLRMVPIG